MVDFRERIEENDTSFGRLRRMIPGFEGYHQREVRRTADRLLRDQLVQVLGEARSDLQRLMDDLARSARLTRLNDLERVGKRLYFVFLDGHFIIRCRKFPVQRICPGRLPVHHMHRLDRPQPR